MSTTIWIIAFIAVCALAWRVWRNRSRGVAALINKATELAERGRSMEAEEYAKLALRFVRDPIRKAAALNAHGLAVVGQGRAAEAAQDFERSLKLLRAHGGEAEHQVRVINNLADAHNSLGRHTEAISGLDDGLVIVKTNNLIRQEGQILSRLGAAYYALFDFDKAEELLNTALRIGRQLQDRKGESATLNGLANVHFRRGDVARALNCMFGAISAAENDPNRLGPFLHNLAAFYHQIRDEQKALATAKQSARIADDIQDLRLKGMVLNNIGNIYLATDRAAEALSNFEAAGQARRAVDDARGLGTTLDGLASTLSRLGRHGEAMIKYEEALEIRRKAGDRAGEGTSLHNIGTLAARHLKDPQRGLELLQEALAIRREIEDRLNEAVTLENIGGIHKTLGDPESALQWHMQAIDVREHLWTLAGAEELQASMEKGGVLSYRAAVALLLELGRAKEAFELTERARARTFLDALRGKQPRARNATLEPLLQKERQVRSALGAAEVEMRRNRGRKLSLAAANLQAKRKEYEGVLLELKLSSLEYGSLVAGSSLSLVEIQAGLDPNITLLSYYDTPDAMFAFIVTADSLSAHRLDVPIEGLSETILRFRRLDRSRDPTPELRQLHEWLIEPLKGFLRTPLIGVAPYQLLHYIPFGALTDGKVFFGDQFSLFYFPSASAFRLLKRKGEVSNVLAIAQGAAPGLPVLAQVDAEATAVASLYPGSLAVTGPQATKALFLAESSKYTAIHIAAHGVLDLRSPMFSRIALGDGSLEVHELYDIELPITDLVVLSACNTQVGPYSAGEELTSLSRGFFFAGASTVIASLWPVDDKATAELMVIFYRRLKENRCKAEALRLAQEEVRRRREYEHPYYWAPFVLCGDPGTHHGSLAR